MKIALTGHTSGLGLEIAKIFQENNHEVMGYSKSNGWDLTDSGVRKRFLEQVDSNSFDCFINNAYPYGKHNTMDGFLQVELLNQVWLKWQKQQGKIIATIGSTTSETVKKHFHPYSVHKNAIDETCKQLRNISSWPQIINIRPGWVDTRAVKTINVEKCDPKDAAELIYTVITSKLQIHEIMFGPFGPSNQLAKI